MFRDAVISALHSKYEKNYISCALGKELWDALEAKFGVSNAGSELYLIGQLYDYKMVKNRSVVEHAHEIEALAKELELFPYPLPNKFVAGGIIAKLPPSWRDFTTSLKHKRQESSVSELIGTLDVEERVRAKDGCGKGVETSAANMVQNKISFAFRNNKKKKNQQENNQNKPKQTIEFKKKNNKKGEGSFFCGKDDHWARACPDRKCKQEKKAANMVISETGGGTSGYGNHLPFVLSVYHSLEWWMNSGANIHVCADVFLFTSYQVGGTRALLMGNSSHARILGVGTVILKVYFGKDGAIEARATCPLHQKESR
jgi:hypothetical protein